MKKSNILIAMFVVIAAATVAKAEDMKVDFDGKSLGSRNFTEAIKNADSGQNIDMAYQQPKPAAVSFGNMGGHGFSLRALAAIDESIKNAISYPTIHSNPLLKKNLEHLLKIGTFKQKYEFVYGSEKVYHFPDSLTDGSVEQCVQRVNNKYDGSEGPLDFSCLEYAYDSVCVNKNVCKYTCVLMGAAAAVYGSVNGVWQIIIPAQLGTQVCKDICENVPVCVESRRCVKWSK